MGNRFVERLSALTKSSLEILPDILMMNFTIVNAFLVGLPGNDTEWVLVDTGLENSADFIVACAQKRCGAASKPTDIILTHGHFDHVGSVITLANFWAAPVYIHESEMP